MAASEDDEDPSAGYSSSDGSATDSDSDSESSDDSDDSSEFEQKDIGKENKNAASAPTPDEASQKESQIGDSDQLEDPPDCWPDKLRTKFDCLNPNVEQGTCLLLYNARKTSYRIIEHSWVETFIVLMIMA